ncbi:MAG: DUF2619 domain-containing protein [Actinobacteria bacterium]|nr:DUF2619 domain-containing protein [Actinomycetota bacterium]
MSETGRVALMAGIRVLVGLANLLAAYLMYRSMSTRTSTAINGVLGAVLPIVFMIVMAIGVSGFASKIPAYKVVLLVTGAAMILVGSR